MFTETTPYDPRSPYSRVQGKFDHLVRAWHETYGLPVVLTNCSNNYGPYHFPEKLIPVVILNALAETLPIYGDGGNIAIGCMSRTTPTRCWFWNRACWDASYNIGGENECARTLNLVKNARAVLWTDCVLSDAGPYADLYHLCRRPTRGMTTRYAIDPSRIRAELGRRPSVAVEEGLERTVQWYLDRPSWRHPLLNRNGVGERLGQNVVILVFGKIGPFWRHNGVGIHSGLMSPSLGRDDCDLETPRKCCAAILRIKPGAVTNAAAYTSR